MYTAKGQATRARIVEAAADLVLERGAGGTSLDDIRAGTRTSKSQLFHYFPGGKQELVGEIAALQSRRVLDAQRPHLDELDTLESWTRWRDAVLAHYGAQTHWSCPVGALSSEVARTDPALREELNAHMEAWRAHLTHGLERLGADAPERRSLGLFATLHGGLQLMQSMHSLAPLEAALDEILSSVRRCAAALP